MGSSSRIVPEHEPFNNYADSILSGLDTVEDDTDVDGYTSVCPSMTARPISVRVSPATMIKFIEDMYDHLTAPYWKHIDVVLVTDWVRIPALESWKFMEMPAFHGTEDTFMLAIDQVFFFFPSEKNYCTFVSQM